MPQGLPLNDTRVLRRNSQRANSQRLDGTIAWLYMLNLQDHRDGNPVESAATPNEAAVVTLDYLIYMSKGRFVQHSVGLRHIAG